jgi:predicted nucleic acid-binding protein
VKFVVQEPESEALQRWSASVGEDVVSSDLARTELLRAVKRHAPDLAVQARAVLEKVALLRLTVGMYEQAGRLEPVSLRTLDALHLACALSLEDDLDGIGTYDDRLAVAAALMGIRTVAPA